jgi:hypothetical protein
VEECGLELGAVSVSLAIQFIVFHSTDVELYQLCCLTTANYIPSFTWLHHIPLLLFLNNGSIVAHKFNNELYSLSTLATYKRSSRLQPTLLLQ